MPYPAKCFGYVQECRCAVLSIFKGFVNYFCHVVALLHSCVSVPEAESMVWQFIN
jgi:hypothetical protein